MDERELIVYQAGRIAQLEQSLEEARKSAAFWADAYIRQKDTAAQPAGTDHAADAR